MTQPASILMADDHPPNLLALEAVLSPLGQPLQPATSGAEALRWLETGDFAVALLDVRMPGLSGLDVAARLRERRIHTPIIFISAVQEDSVVKAEGYARGAVDFIVKPFNPNVLRAKVNTFVQLHARRLELERRLGAERSRVRRLRELLHGILDFSLAGRTRGEPELLPVHELLSDVIERCAVPACATIELETGLTELCAERAPLRQVLSGLLGDALEHARPEAPRVCVAVRDLGSSYQFTVSDNGPGVAPELDEPRGSVEDGGGLSIVEKIVASQGGRAWVEPREGEGATSSFTWPKAEAAPRG
jgi:CheY-like chemotaxis protein